MSHWIVLGSGFRGMVGAYMLSQKCQKVTLVDKSSRLGGVMNSIEWGDFEMDLGCHLFENRQNEFTGMMREIMDDEVVPVRVQYGSTINGKITKGISIPDFSSFGMGKWRFGKFDLHNDLQDELRSVVA